MQLNSDYTIKVKKMEKFLVTYKVCCTSYFWGTRCLEDEHCTSSNLLIVPFSIVLGVQCTLFVCFLLHEEGMEYIQWYENLGIMSLDITSHKEVKKLLRPIVSCCQVHLIQKGDCFLAIFKLLREHRHLNWSRDIIQTVKVHDQTKNIAMNQR